jgi:tetratricopeptide (TPR) repeat protein
MWWMRLGEWARPLRLKWLARHAARRVEGLVEGQPFAQMWVAQVLAESGDSEGAVRVACAAEGWPLGDTRAYEILGLTLQEMGQVTKALPYLREAVSRGSMDLEVWYAYILESVKEIQGDRRLPQAERISRGEALLALALQTESRAPDRLDSHFAVATCLSLLGRVAEAHAAFTKAAALQPDSEDLRQLLERSAELTDRS